MKSLAFAFSVGLVFVLILLVWVLDVLAQTPGIPPQTPDKTYIEIILPRKKHNPIDDFCVPCAAPIAVNQSERRAIVTHVVRLSVPQ